MCECSRQDGRGCYQGSSTEEQRNYSNKVCAGSEVLNTALLTNKSDGLEAEKQEGTSGTSMVVIWHLHNCEGLLKLIEGKVLIQDCNLSGTPPKKPLKTALQVW